MQTSTDIQYKMWSKCAQRFWSYWIVQHKKQFLKYLEIRKAYGKGVLGARIKCAFIFFCSSFLSRKYRVFGERQNPASLTVTQTRTLKQFTSFQKCTYVFRMRSIAPATRDFLFSTGDGSVTAVQNDGRRFRRLRRLAKTL
jgi:hypothetical protein